MLNALSNPVEWSLPMGTVNSLQQYLEANPDALKHLIHWLPDPLRSPDYGMYEEAFNRALLRVTEEYTGEYSYRSAMGKVFPWEMAKVKRREARHRHVEYRGTEVAPDARVPEVDLSDLTPEDRRLIRGHFGIDGEPRATSGSTATYYRRLNRILGLLRLTIGERM